MSERLRDALPATEAHVDTWTPNDDDGDIFDAFQKRLGDSTQLVITDWDLSTGARGLFGTSLMEWCKNLAIPAGDFSRGRPNALPKEPELFELRVPVDHDDSTRFIVRTFRGFRTLRAAVSADDAVAKRHSLARLLAELLGRPHLEGDFGLYMSRLGASNASLIQQARSDDLDEVRKAQLITYILGHVLLNSVLRYPGPLLKDEALCAYFGTTVAEADTLAPLFAEARYEGPFADAERIYWRETVDSILERLSEGMDDAEYADFGDFNRLVVERHLDHRLAAHGCSREACGGLKGGFWCPFTTRPVCVRADCSVPSSSWIPEGAQLCRVEREFYDEWAPIMAL
jgi:hypothetical protein